MWGDIWKTWGILWSLWRSLKLGEDFWKSQKDLLKSWCILKSTDESANVPESKSPQFLLQKPLKSNLIPKGTTLGWKQRWLFRDNFDWSQLLLHRQREKGRRAREKRKLNLHFRTATGGLWLHFDFASRWSSRVIPSPDIPLTLTLIVDHKSSRQNWKGFNKSYEFFFQHHKSPTQCKRSVISIDQHVVRWLFNGIFTVKTFILHNGKAILSPIVFLLQHSRAVEVVRPGRRRNANVCKWTRKFFRRQRM
jgi:hypothetical protein